MKKALIFVLLTFFVKSEAQNLVPNPDFEDTIPNPNWIGGFHGMCADWINLTPGTADYWTDLNPFCPGCASLAHIPRSGNAYAGFYTYDIRVTDGREAISVQLYDTLEVGKKYCVEFYTSRYREMNYACGNIGAYFSSSPPSTSSGIVSFVPQISNDPTNDHLTDDVNWIKISGSFIANGNEQWMTITNFSPDNLIDTTFTGGGSTTDTVTYYFVDDISVILCPDTIPPITENYLYIPNAFSPNGDGNNDFLFVRGKNIDQLSFTVYDRWGQRVFETHSIDEGWDGMYNGERMENAVFAYYLTLTYMDGKTAMKKGNISLVR